MINCSNCNTQISDFAKKCPKCGCQIKTRLNYLGKNRWITIGVVVAILVLIGSSIAIPRYEAYKEEQKRIAENNRRKQENKRKIDEGLAAVNDYFSGDIPWADETHEPVSDYYFDQFYNEETGAIEYYADYGDGHLISGSGYMEDSLKYGYEYEERESIQGSYLLNEYWVSSDYYPTKTAYVRWDGHYWDKELYQYAKSRVELDIENKLDVKVIYDENINTIRIIKYAPY